MAFGCLLGPKTRGTRNPNQGVGAGPGKRSFQNPKALAMQVHTACERPLYREMSGPKEGKKEIGHRVSANPTSSRDRKKQSPPPPRSVSQSYQETSTHNPFKPVVFSFSAKANPKPLTSSSPSAAQETGSRSPFGLNSPLVLVSGEKGDDRYG